jgi:DUF971 family protein
MSFDNAAAVRAEVPKDPWPSEIALNKRDRTLDLVWDSATASVLQTVLRASCRCTECESIRRKTGATIAPEPDVELSKIEAVGSVGLQFFFSDGHSRGIYPWPYLRQIAYGGEVVATDV